MPLNDMVFECGGDVSHQSGVASCTHCTVFRHPKAVSIAGQQQVIYGRTTPDSPTPQPRNSASAARWGFAASDTDFEGQDSLACTCPGYHSKTRLGLRMLVPVWRDISMSNCNMGYYHTTKSKRKNYMKSNIYMILHARVIQAAPIPAAIRKLPIAKGLAVHCVSSTTRPILVWPSTLR